jgi:hypothetical protein
MDPQEVRDLLWAPVQLQQDNDILPILWGQVKAAAYASPSGGCIAVGRISTISSIDRLFVACKFPADRTGGTLELASDLSVGSTAYPKLRDMVAFILRELKVTTHV